MNVQDIPSRKVILLVGGPRSGTTWLGKIFDSHPSVLYRHEPDSVLRNPRLRRAFAIDEVPDYVPEARNYARELIGLRALKTAGSLPSFPKNYLPRAVSAGRAAMILGLRGVELLGRASGFKPKLSVPDLVPSDKVASLRMVIKSNALRVRLRLFAEALPGCRIVLILRDPYGHAASMRRGVELGLLQGSTPLTECLDLDEARRHNLTKERFAALSPVEQIAWHWGLLNEKAINDLDGVPGATIVRYRDLCLDPLGEAQRLFAFTDLPWNPQTEAFVQHSTSPPLLDRYYQVRKQSLDSLNKWRTQLSATECDQITDIFRKTALWKRYPEFHDKAPAPPRRQPVPALQ